MHLYNRRRAVSPEPALKEGTPGWTCDNVDYSPCNSCDTMGLAPFLSLEGLHERGGADYICLWYRWDFLTHLKWFMGWRRQRQSERGGGEGVWESGLRMRRKLEMRQVWVMSGWSVRGGRMTSLLYGWSAWYRWMCSDESLLYPDMSATFGNI